MTKSVEHNQAAKSSPVPDAFALENAAEPYKNESPRDYLLETKAALRLIRRARKSKEMPEPVARFLHTVIELAQASKRGFAHFQKKKDICDLTGLDPTQIAPILEWCKARNILMGAEPYFAIRLGKWLLEAKLKDGAQLLLELNCDSPVRQPYFEREPNLEDLLRSLFDPGSTKVDPQSTLVGAGSRSVDPRSTPTAPNYHDQGHGTFSMPHARTLNREFEVGALGRKSGQEILDQIREVAADLQKEHVKGWIRRISENAELCWRLSTELKQRHNIRLRAAWLNSAYMREMKIGRYSES